jgi:hypothetical protein
MLRKQQIKSKPTVPFNMIYFAQGNSMITKKKRQQIRRDKRCPYHSRCIEVTSFGFVEVCFNFVTVWLIDYVTAE